jgi:hypothetical protein
MVRDTDPDLQKRVFTEADFDQMGWHDATVWAIGFLSGSYELVLDIDYILKWMPPAANDENHRFWLAPATLVFHNVYGLSFDVEFPFDVSIDQVERRDPATPRNATAVGKSTEWTWILTFPAGTISLRSTGFTQYIRRRPVLVTQQTFSLEGRGGTTFATTPYEQDSGDL